MDKKKEGLILIAITLIVIAIFIKPIYKPLFSSHNEEHNYQMAMMHFPGTECDFNQWAVQYEKQAVNTISDAMQHCQYGIPIDTMRKAITLLQKSISVYDKYQLGYTVLIQYQAQIKDYSGAFKTLNEAKKSLPDNPQIATLGGYLYDITGERQQADHEYELAIGLCDKKMGTKHDVSDITLKSILISFIQGNKKAMEYINKEYAARHYNANDKSTLEMLALAFENNSITRDDLVKNEMTNPMIN